MIAGGCHCGAVRYTLALDDLPAVYCCHCLKCQSWAGSAFTEQAPVSEGALSVEGPVVEYSFTNPSGSTSRQRVCGTCHTRIYNTNSARPGLAMVRAGTLDRSDELVPAAHIWVKRKQPWVVIADDVPQWPESAPMAEFAAVLSR
ncbi:GFA family protein [Sphingomonas sp. KR3-1]|uniref:GFA family protein n=1 Tax=Sphingomonas sp. KR3-1 TaxID=3156611 RepID=UPI0032B5FB74